MSHTSIILYHQKLKPSISRVGNTVIVMSLQNGQMYPILLPENKVQVSEPQRSLDDLVKAG